MKKLFVILLSAVLIFSMIGTAYAGSIQGDDKSNPDKITTSKVTLTLTDSYTVTVPDSFKLDEVDENEDGAIDYYSTVESIKGKVKHIADDSNLVVNVTSNDYSTDGGWYLKKVEGSSYSTDNTNDWFRYYMRVGEHVDGSSINDDGDNLGNNEAVLTINCNTHTEITVNLHVKLINSPTKAGVYEDILTFKASVVHE